MTKPVLQIGIVLLIGSCAFPVYGQDKTDHLLAMFDDAASVEWVRTMEGSVNDLHPVRISLGYDGDVYKGNLTLEADDLSFDLIGHMDRDALVLQEIDSNGLHTGYIVGTLGDDRFNGQWWSVDMSRNADLTLVDEGLILLREFKPRMAVLQGAIDKDQFHCILFVESTGVVSGTWQRADECIRMLGQCEDMVCDEMVLKVSEGELKGARIHLATQDQKDFTISVDNVSWIQHGSAKVVDDIPLISRARADYAFIIDFAYPEILAGNFNAWIDSKLNGWYSNSLDTFLGNKLNNPESRWSQTATSWMDIFFYNDQIISGLITSFNPDEGIYERESFIYDIRNLAELTLAELCKKDRDLLSALQSNIRVDGIDSKEFKYPVLTKSGFFVCTDFDSVEGDRSAMVGYEAVEKVLRRKAFFTKLEQ